MPEVPKVKLIRPIIIGLVWLLFLVSPVFSFAATTQLELQMSPFPAPTNLTATVISSSRIDLNWSPVSIAINYKVYRDGILIASLTTTSYSDTGLTPGTTYSYTVSAVNVFGGESKQSSSISATTRVVGGVYIPPSAPPPSPLSPEAQKVDTNKDGKIDIFDFDTLMANWGAGCLNVADFNGDCIVDLFDFNLLMIYWTG